MFIFYCKNILYPLSPPAMTGCSVNKRVFVFIRTPLFACVPLQAAGLVGPRVVGEPGIMLVVCIELSTGQFYDKLYF